MLGAEERTVLCIPSPRGLAHSTRDILLRKLSDANNRPFPTTFSFLSFDSDAFDYPVEPTQPEGLLATPR